MVEELMDKPRLNRAEGEKLELVSLLVSHYEKEKYPINPPSPVDAILFRIDQLNLKREELIPYIGSKSKVSEVLSGKRKLSKQMMKNLHEGLGIPLESLFNDDMKIDLSGGRRTEPDWTKFPLREMAKRNWIKPANQVSVKKCRDATVAKKLIEQFLNGFDESFAVPAYLKNGISSCRKDPDAYALAVWRVRILQKAKQERLIGKYRSEIITSDFCSELAKLSYLLDGPLLAKEFLGKNGIHLVIEQHLSSTYLDGAAMFLNGKEPIIGMTLRFDRLDNFWFVLFHELAHIKLHLTHEKEKYFLEDLENKSTVTEELEADEWAKEGLIPEVIWEAAKLGIHSSEKDVVRFANSLRISPAIVAGRIRRENEKFTIFDKLLGRNKLRIMFNI
jgi:HTH-type transcriptional regulator/antitoxin HigA